MMAEASFFLPGFVPFVRHQGYRYHDHKGHQQKQGDAGLDGGRQCRNPDAQEGIPEHGVLHVHLPRYPEQR